MASVLVAAVVMLASPGLAPASSDPAAEPPDRSCEQTAYVLREAVQQDSFTWVLNVDSVPGYLDPDGVTTAVEEATLSIARADSPCLSGGAGAQVPPAIYGGSTRRHATVTPETECFSAEDSDGISVVSFGVLPEEVVAIACTYSERGDIWQSDILLNDGWGVFTLDPGDSCVDSFDLQSVLTHERGHSFGLGHVPENAEAADLTMSPYMGRCDLSARTLGRGDVLGLMALY
jgi:hypothetical protein